MKVGFTGNRLGMTDSQMLWLYEYLGKAKEFHHGDCIGADAQAHVIAESLGIWIVVHPPTDGRLRANCRGSESRDPAPYLERDARIVAETEVLIAAPSGETEQLRSGTWATIRMARRRQLPHIIVFPSGVAEMWSVETGMAYVRR